MSYFKYCVSLVIILFCTVISISAQTQPAMSIKAKADSTVLVQGDRVSVTIEVIKNSHDGKLVDLPAKEKDYYGLEMEECTVDSTDLGNNRIQLNYNLIFQAFDPAEILTLPPFRYAVGTDTIASDILTFKVLPVDLSPELGDPNDIESLTIHPDEPPVAVPAKWYDYIPDWFVWVFIALIVAALGIVLYMLYRKNGKNLFTPAKPIPPYELAKMKLVNLKERHLLDQGQVKQYYTELIDIFRNYLEGRFGINAMEMPSKMILRKIRENKEIHLSASQMEQVLQLADFVKFAAAHPNPEDGLRTFNTICDFVENTKPAVEEPNPENTTRK